MKGMPDLLADGRGMSLARITFSVLIQAAAAGLAALATRSLFVALAEDAPSADPLWLAILVLSGATLALFRIDARVQGERMGQSYAHAVRRALYRHASRMPQNAVDERRAGYMSLRFVGDLAALKSWGALGLPRLIGGAVVLPTTARVLYLIEPLFARVAAPLMALGVAIMLGIGHRLYNRHRALRSRRARIAADLTERMPLAPRLDMLGRTRQELALIDKRTAEMIPAAIARVRGAELVKAVPDALAGMIAATILATGFWNGNSTADLAGALAALGLSLQPIRDLASVQNQRAAWRAAQEKCAAVFERPVRRRGKPKRPAPAGPLGIRISDLTLGPLSNLTLSAEAGEHVALLGPNGSGKSTLLAALAGLVEPEGGRIRVGGTAPVAAQGQTRVALLTQEAPVLRGSLRKALTLGLRKRPTDDVLHARIAEVGLDPLLHRLGGLDGSVGEGARDLSYGERAKIALVRTILGRSSLLLIDRVEPLLDPPGQRALQTLIEETNATVVRVIAGRSEQREDEALWDLTSETSVGHTAHST